MSKISLSKDSEEFISLESLIKKVAEDCKIDRVEEVLVTLGKAAGLVRFKVSMDSMPVRKEDVPPIVYNLIDPKHSFNEYYVKGDVAGFSQFTGIPKETIVWMFGKAKGLESNKAIAVS